MGDTWYIKLSASNATFYNQFNQIIKNLKYFNSRKIWFFGRFRRFWSVLTSEIQVFLEQKCFENSNSMFIWLNWFKCKIGCIHCIQFAKKLEKQTQKFSKTKIEFFRGLLGSRSQVKTQTECIECNRSCILISWTKLTKNFRS